MNISPSKVAKSSKWSFGMWLFVIVASYLVIVGVPYSLLSISTGGTDTAIVVLGGGLTNNGDLPPHTLLRVAKAQQLYKQLSATGAAFAPVVITLSGGTTHKPNPTDSRGFPIWEATAAARDLIKSGIDPAHVFEENFSLDTIGNAYFLRTIHTEPSNIRNLHIITNNWHMERTQAIFKHVFSLPWDSVAERSWSQAQDRLGLLPLCWVLLSKLENALGFGPKTHYRLSFHEVESGVADKDILKLRKNRERASLVTFLTSTINSFDNMSKLREFLYLQHGAYASKRLGNGNGQQNKSNHTNSVSGGDSQNALPAELLKTY